MRRELLSFNITVYAQLDGENHVLTNHTKPANEVAQIPLSDDHYPRVDATSTHTPSSVAPVSNVDRVKSVHSTPTPQSRHMATDEDILTKKIAQMLIDMTRSQIGEQTQDKSVPVKTEPIEIATNSALDTLLLRVVIALEKGAEKLDQLIVSQEKYNIFHERLTQAIAEDVIDQRTQRATNGAH